MTPDEQDRARETARINAQATYEFSKKKLMRLYGAVFKWGAISMVALIGGCMVLLAR